MLADDIIHQYFWRPGEHQASHPIHDHQNESASEEPETRTHEDPDFRPGGAQAGDKLLFLFVFSHLDPEEIGAPNGDRLFQIVFRKLLIQRASHQGRKLGVFSETQGDQLPQGELGNARAQWLGQYLL